MDLIYKTRDGREFTNEAVAKHHADLLDRIDGHLNAHEVGDSRRKKLREMFVAWEAKREAGEK